MLASRAHGQLPQRDDRPGRHGPLDPDPAAPLAALTEAVARRRPEAPPYGGRFDEVHPHLTVAEEHPPADFAAIEAGLTRALPVATRVTAVDLVVFDGARWQADERFPLRDPGGPAAG